MQYGVFIMNDSTKVIKSMEIYKKIEFSKNSSHCFVNIQFDLQKVCFGNEDAWSVSGLVLGSVNDLCQKLNVQTTLSETVINFMSNLDA